MDALRRPFFLIALVAAGLVVLVELGSSLLIGGHDATAALAGQAQQLGVEQLGGGTVREAPGRAISYLALVDGIVLYTAALMGASLLVPEKLHGRLQGVLTLVGAIVLIVVAVGLALAAVAELLVMVSLLFAPPFGTIAYLVVWGSFPRGDAAVLLSLLMFLKLVFAGALLLAHQRFLQNKGLVALVLTALVANIAVAFLHGMVPGVLVSILDDVGAVIVAILAIVWGVVLLVGSIPAVVKAARA
jgi:hypothetical protein